MILAIVYVVEEFVERDAVHKALMALLRQDVKGNLVLYSSLLRIWPRITIGKVWNKEWCIKFHFMRQKAMLP